MRATVNLRKLGDEEEIQGGDFHRLENTPGLYPVREAIGRKPGEWNRAYCSNLTQREFFRIDTPLHAEEI